MGTQRNLTELALRLCYLPEEGNDRNKLYTEHSKLRKKYQIKITEELLRKNGFEFFGNNEWRNEGISINLVDKYLELIKEDGVILRYIYKTLSIPDLETLLDILEIKKEIEI